MCHSLFCCLSLSLSKCFSFSFCLSLPLMLPLLDALSHAQPPSFSDHVASEGHPRPRHSVSLCYPYTPKTSWTQSLPEIASPTALNKSWPCSQYFHWTLGVRKGFLEKSIDQWAKSVDFIICFGHRSRSQISVFFFCLILKCIRARDSSNQPSQLINLRVPVSHRSRSQRFLCLHNRC